MVTKYLIDSNAVIDFFNGKLPQIGEELLVNADPIISIITRIEIFCSRRISDQELAELNRFISIADIINIDQSVVNKAIALRLKHKIKLPDAVIAATAITHELVLVTRNFSDFDTIEGLDIINPYTV